MAADPITEQIINARKLLDARSRPWPRIAQFGGAFVRVRSPLDPPEYLGKDNKWHEIEIGDGCAGD